MLWFEFMMYIRDTDSRYFFTNFLLLVTQDPSIRY